MKINNQSFSNKNEKLIGKFKIETLKIIWIDEFICLRSKTYAFKGRDNCKIKLKGFSKPYSKDIKFEEYYSCLLGRKYQQECDNYIARSLNQQMYLPRGKKIYTIPI